MNTLGPGLRAIITINFTFFFGAFLCAIAWLCWPDAKEAWRMGLLSIVCGFGGVLQIIKGCIEIVRHLLRDRAVGAFHHQGRAPQADHLADNDALRKSGMIK